VLAAIADTGPACRSWTPKLNVHGWLTVGATNALLHVLSVCEPVLGDLVRFGGVGDDGDARSKGYNAANASC
jgi:hypothetical protein